MANSIPIAVRSSNGISLQLGPPKFGCEDSFEKVQSKTCKNMLFSPDGQYFAYTDGAKVKILRTDNWKNEIIIEGVKAYHLAFSPKTTYLMTWEQYAVNKENPQGKPNLNIYLSESGKLVKSFVQKNQGNWEPQWSKDEKLFTRIINNDVIFYEDCNFERIVTRINCFKVASYSLSPNIGSYYVLCHNPGTSGQPSFGRLFKYPNFGAQQSISSKSFFQADRVEFKWNLKGNNALLLTSTEVDKTGGSYYGKQGLHFVGLNGQTSVITPSKEGPIYSVAWSPKNTEFCVVYGFMPAKVTVYNLKCDPVFEFGTGPRNSIYYNPHGNLLLLGGFGNLRGQIEIYDTRNNQKVGSCEAPDSTYLEWSPDGIHFLTATTAPRLRIGNGFKIWHYSGALLFEKAAETQEEIYEVCWKNYPINTFKEPDITNEKVTGIVSNQPVASKQVYRPPSARNRPGINFSLNDDFENPHKPEIQQSKASIKNKKKREAKKQKKIEENISECNNSGDNMASSTATTNVSSVQITLTGDPDIDKKLKSLKRKLDAIEKLKEQQALGKPLEINQIAKIKCEDDLLKELQQLQV